MGSRDGGRTSVETDGEVGLETVVMGIGLERGWTELRGRVEEDGVKR